MRKNVLAVWVRSSIRSNDRSNRWIFRNHLCLGQLVVNVIIPFGMLRQSLDKFVFAIYGFHCEDYKNDIFLITNYIFEGFRRFQRYHMLLLTDSHTCSHVNVTVCVCICVDQQFDDSWAPPFRLSNCFYSVFFLHAKVDLFRFFKKSCQIFLSPKIIWMCSNYVDVKQKEGEPLNFLVKPILR